MGGWLSAKGLYTTEIKADNKLLSEIHDNFILSPDVLKKKINVYFHLEKVHWKNLKVGQSWYLQFTFGKGIHSGKTNIVSAKETKVKFDNFHCEFEAQLLVEDLLK